MATLVDDMTDATAKLAEAGAISTDLAAEIIGRAVLEFQLTKPRTAEAAALLAIKAALNE